MIGASSRWTFGRIAEYADGWLPIHQNPARAKAQGVVDYAAGIAQVREQWAAAGRQGQPDFSIFGVGPDAGRVAELLAMGFGRVIFGLPSADADMVVPLLDRYAELAHHAHAPN